jgi:hypothetical protein
MAQTEERIRQPLRISFAQGAPARESPRIAMIRHRPFSTRNAQPAENTSGILRDST